MRTRVAGGLIGIVFGVTLSWTGMTSPNVIRDALLFKSSYLFLMFAGAVAVSFAGLRLARLGRRRALLTGERVHWVPQRPERRHVVGSLIFGIGWGITDACPGPVATQIGQGIWWGLCTFAGIVAGVYIFTRRSTETEPASDARPALGTTLATEPSG